MVAVLVVEPETVGSREVMLRAMSLEEIFDSGAKAFGLGVEGYTVLTLDPRMVRHLKEGFAMIELQHTVLPSYEGTLHESWPSCQDDRQHVNSVANLSTSPKAYARRPRDVCDHMPSPCNTLRFGVSPTLQQRSYLPCWPPHMMQCFRLATRVTILP